MREAARPSGGAPTSSDPARALDLLLGRDGQQLLGTLAGEDRVDPGVELALGERLRVRYPPDLVAAALAQHDLRVRAGAKFSRAERMYLTRDGLEQASSEQVARHRAARYAAFDRVADLCSGIGGDLLALAAGRAALAVDRDPVHLRMALRNAREYGAEELAGICGDVRELRLDAIPAVFVDPARRVAGRRLRPGASEPPLAWCAALAGRVDVVGVKTAPGLPLGLVPTGWEVELIADRRELKEAVLWSPAMATAPRRATVLPGGQSLVAEAGQGEVPCAPPGVFLLDPNPAVTRAGLIEELARATDAWKIDRQVGFLSADHPLETPFGRLLVVEESMPWGLKRLRAALRARGAGAVQIRKRGSAVDVEDLRRRLDLRGDQQATVVLTRVLDRPWALICRDP
jgi:hypothetical protein